MQSGFPDPPGTRYIASPQSLIEAESFICVMQLSMGGCPFSYLVQRDFFHSSPQVSSFAYAIGTSALSSALLGK